MFREIEHLLTSNSTDMYFLEALLFIRAKSPEDLASKLDAEIDRIAPNVAELYRIEGSLTADQKAAFKAKIKQAIKEELPSAFQIPEGYVLSYFAGDAYWPEGLDDAGIVDQLSTDLMDLADSDNENEDKDENEEENDDENEDDNDSDNEDDEKAGEGNSDRKPGWTLNGFKKLLNLENTKWIMVCLINILKQFPNPPKDALFVALVAKDMDLVNWVPG